MYTILLKSLQAVCQSSFLGTGQRHSSEAFERGLAIHPARVSGDGDSSAGKRGHYWFRDDVPWALLIGVAFFSNRTGTGNFLISAPPQKLYRCPHKIMVGTVVKHCTATIGIRDFA
jgi:hypothetical protein